MNESILAYIGFALLLMFALFPVLNATESGFELTTDINTTNVSTVEADGNWSSPVDGTVISNTCSGTDSIYPQADSSCSWTVEYNVSQVQGRPLQIGYSADMSDGSGNWTVRAYTSGTLEEKQQSIITGDSVNVSLSESLSFEKSDYDKLQVELQMNESKGTDNEKPVVDSYYLDYANSFTAEEFGLDNQAVSTMIVLFFLGVVMLALWKA